MQRILAVLLFCVGLLCLAQAQVPMTGAGTGAPGGGGGGPTVTIDAVGTVSNSTPYMGLTITASLHDPALVVVVTVDSGTSMISPTATWDAAGGSPQSMTLLINQDAGGGREVAIFGLRNPHSGNLRLDIVRGSLASIDINAISFFNVNQTNDATAFPNFIGSNTGATPLSITITSGANNYAVAGYAATANFTSVSDNQLFLDNTGSTWAVAANYKASAGATVTLTGSPGHVTSSFAGGAIAHD